MPGTWKEVIHQNPDIPDTASPFNPKYAIPAQIYYDKKLTKYFKDVDEPEEKMRFTFASYNAGPGHIIKARKLARKNGLSDKAWVYDVKKIMPAVTGKHSFETIAYVKRIDDVYSILKKIPLHSKNITIKKSKILNNKNQQSRNFSVSFNIEMDEERKTTIGKMSNKRIMMILGFFIILLSMILTMMIIFIRRN